MKNTFYNDIYEILLGKGLEGLPVGIIARQVYNRHTGLFSKDLSYEKVYQTVRFSFGLRLSGQDLHLRLATNGDGIA